MFEQKSKSTNQIDMLDSILFDWNPILKKWENGFQLLCLYKSVNGNNIVPRSHVIKEEVRGT